MGQGMIGKLRKWFGTSQETEKTGGELDAVQFSVAVLLVEIARADYEHTEIESRKMQQQLTSKFGLSDDETAQLITAAEEAVEKSVSLHDYTKALHSEMSYTEKEAVIEMLWHIAMADQNLDKYEDYMIGKIAELLYIYRGDVIRLKHRVIESISQAGE
jgi:uncharacterized tellurite resistance protein B-like protein